MAFKILASILMLVCILSTTALGIVASFDETRIVLHSILEGKTVALIKIFIKIPPIKAGECMVAVHKLIPGTYSKRIFVDLAKPGQTVLVRYITPVVPESYGIDEEGNPVVKYWTPQQFFVIVHCIDSGGKTVLNFVKSYYVPIKKLITTLVVDVDKEMKSFSKRITRSATSDEDTYWWDDCVIQITNDRGDDKYGYCVTWVAVAKIHAIYGLKTRFEIRCYPRSTAIFLESFGRACSEFNPGCPYDVPWNPMGKVLTSSTVSQNTSFISPPNPQWHYIGVVIANVEYLYEYHRWCRSRLGYCHYYELLYPSKIKGVKIPYIIIEWNHPPIPPYATGPIRGNVLITFSDRSIDEGRTIGIKTKLGIELFRSLDVYVDVYATIRVDQSYIGPLVRIVDISGKNYDWYYWWHKDNDPLNYEVIVASSQ